MPDLMLHLRGNKRLAAGSKSPFPVGAGNTPMLDASGTVAAIGAAQDVLPERDYRYYLLIANLPANTGVLWVNFGADATAGAGSIPLAAGDALVFESTYVPTERVSILGTVAGEGFTVKEG